MEVRFSGKQYVVAALAACLLLSFGAALGAASYPPGLSSNSVESALTQSDGERITCEGVVVDKISAWTYPSYFSICDGFHQASKIIVMCAPPSYLAHGLALDVEGVLGTLPNGERCLCEPTMYAYVGQDRQLVMWSPLLPFLGSIAREAVVTPQVDLVVGEATTLEDPPLPPQPPTSTYPTPEEYASVEAFLDDGTPPTDGDPVKLTYRRVAGTGGTGSGAYVMVGDDDTTAAVKVYTLKAIGADDRIIHLTGQYRVESGTRVICIDSGPTGVFDPQGYLGSVLSARRDAVAYAGSLPDDRWVYLTGRVVTADGVYDGTECVSSVFYVQSLDRTPGIRALNANAGSTTLGSVVDIVAKLDTKDQERLLGRWNGGSVEDLEYKHLAGPGYIPLLPLSVTTTNRSLGGNALGNNPGITGAQDLYNVGGLVTVTGRIAYSDHYTYALIDDGSGVDSDPAQSDPYVRGVVLFDSNWLPWGWDVDDYMAVTGVSSVWSPGGGSGSTYRCIRFPTAVARSVDPYGNWVLGPPSNSQTIPTRQVTKWGTLKGAVHIYGGPSNGSVTVTVHSTTGRAPVTVTVVCGSNGTGSEAYQIPNVPKEVLVGTGTEYGQYIVSGQADGFKTRTYTNLDNWVDANPSPTGESWELTRDIYLVPLRKLYLTTDTTSVSPCPGGQSAMITAKVRDWNHDPLNGLDIKFWTDKGSFDPVDPDVKTARVTVQEHTPGSPESRYATVTLYGTGPDEKSDATVMATDDTDTPDPVDASFSGSGDPYYYDWQRGPCLEGSTCTGDGSVVHIADDDATFAVEPASAYPAPKIKVCDTYQITATLRACGGPVVGHPVHFHIDSGPGVFVESPEAPWTSYDPNTDSQGTATATVRPTGAGMIYISVTSTLNRDTFGDSRQVEVVDPVPSVTVAPDAQDIHGPDTPSVAFHATDIDGVSPKAGLDIRLTTTAGTLEYPLGTPLNPPTITTSGSGDAQVFVRLDPPQSASVTGTYTDECGTEHSVVATIRYSLLPWKAVGVNYSSPLVADLIAGDGPEVAVIANTDGKIHLWKSNGDSVSVSDTEIDQDANNTLSAANIDGDAAGTLEIVAPSVRSFGNPSVNAGRMFAYGYDGAVFKPLAGWPASSPWAYTTAAAALGDTNLDGTAKAVSGDLSCIVSCWNSMGDNSGLLWRHLTLGTGVSIENSTPAIGDVNATLDAYHIPDAVIGAETSPGIWGFAGDERHDYYLHPNPYQWNYTAGWDSGNAGSVQCSPVTAKIDSDDYNDVAVGDNNGTMWAWLSSDSEWHPYNLAGTGDPLDRTDDIRSSPAIANLDGQTCIIFGCNNGRVYAIHANGSEVAGWEDGILLKAGTREDPESYMAETPYSVRCSPLVGNVVAGTADPQVIVGCLDGTVYALWKDGNNHRDGNNQLTGPVARRWGCTQSDAQTILATPTFCSLDGEHLDLIVGSTDGIYRVHFDGTNGIEHVTFDASNWAKWPWRTFHYDSARTGFVPPSSMWTPTLVSSSVVGRVTAADAQGTYGLNGVSVYITDLTAGDVLPVIFNRPGEQRPDPITTLGNGTARDEINEGGFVVGQLTPGHDYRLTFRRPGYTDREVTVTAVPVGISRATYAY